MGSGSCGGRGGAGDLDWLEVGERARGDGWLVVGGGVVAGLFVSEVSSVVCDRAVIGWLLAWGMVLDWLRVISCRILEVRIRRH